MTRQTTKASNKSSFSVTTNTLLHSLRTAIAPDGFVPNTLSHPILRTRPPLSGVRLTPKFHQFPARQLPETSDRRHAGPLPGMQIRYRVPEALFRSILKWALTLLALRMIYLTLL